MGADWVLPSIAVVFSNVTLTFLMPKHHQMMTECVGSSEAKAFGFKLPFSCFYRFERHIFFIASLKTLYFVVVVVAQVQFHSSFRLN